MDIQIGVEDFKGFLKKCHCGGMVKDLVIQADSENGIFARFSGKGKDFYGEVYCSTVKVNIEGTIKVPHLKKLMDVIGRADSKLIRIISNEDAFCVTEGSGLGKMKTDMLQVSEADAVESFSQFQNKQHKMFDRKNLNYIGFDDNYVNGVRITCGMLSEVLKDAKAFGYEMYNFQYKEAKGKKRLKCYIVNQYTTEKIQRTVADDNFIGDLSQMSDSFVGKGFREMLDAILTEEKNFVELYFHEDSWLITDRSTYFYNVHTIAE